MDSLPCLLFENQQDNQNDHKEHDPRHTGDNVLKREKRQDWTVISFFSHARPQNRKENCSRPSQIR
ncbi:hypothetical protein SDC9_164039 [bioreactor metagenome]|uniref:Uncharacterized protein n=1 Tax=bioreactor metagenome TaxID=1076179 RepID=A0A645FXS4_9ZZZZ